MKSYQIHIEGIVQGVGFRPFVYKLAIQENLTGWVNNTTDGVHIHINLNLEKTETFLNKILNHLPPLAVVTNSSILEVPFEKYDDFNIVHSEADNKPKLLLTPDAAICKDCKKELYDLEDRRYQYPFITCTNCGPRYSIINNLPYDRPYTTMESFKMCDICLKEYDNPLERRHYSQTNSCDGCKIEMQLFENGDFKTDFQDLDYIVKQWEKGKIIAIKGIGGYLLTCDATKANVIQLLRKRKHRATKPFALMYPSIDSIEEDTHVSENELNELTNKHAPIVLLETKEKIRSRIALRDITHGLSRLGVMLPYTPLYDLLLNSFGKPIIATSANITNSTIIYTDDKAIEELTRIADIILLNNRKILLPQDDGVVQFSNNQQQKIVLRRSRGKAPNYINPELNIPNKTVFATGAMLKSTFGFFNMQNTYISQYMGNTASYDAQLNYEHSFRHFKNIFKTHFDAVVVDKHPDYFATRFGKELARVHGSELIEIQHHKAHFYSVLGENLLLGTKEPVMGVIWDGTGLGDDGNIWGGEFFIYKNKIVERVGHIGEFDFILGDKMPKEPRISALAITYNINGFENYLKEKFTEPEWMVYSKLLSKPVNLKSTSMGRVFDAVSSLLYGFDLHTFEAEASMQLENKAAEYYYENEMTLNDSFFGENTPKHFVNELFKSLLLNIAKEQNPSRIAACFHVTLVDFILKQILKNEIKQVAFSGGVFQNALLNDILIENKPADVNFYFHKEFSPNDEGIPFGQLMYYTDKMN